MATKPGYLRLSIPTSWGETVSQAVLTVIVVFFTMVALLNLVAQAAVIVSCLWLALVVFRTWSACRDEGGLRRFLRRHLDPLARSRFVESVPRDTECSEIRFGYRLLGLRLLHLRLAVDRIETVEWRTGQATSLAGYDVNDWRVILRFDHDDPSKRQESSRKPDQDIYIVGPSRRRKDTEDFALSFVEFLLEAGASLARGEDGCSFVRDAGPGQEGTR